MILCDWRLRNLGFLYPWKEEHLNPASIDVTIGRSIIRELSHGRMEKLDIPNTGYPVEPGDFLLAQTEERFLVPNGYAVELRLKSTIARSGFDHAMAVWIDPGFSGVITLEVKNCLRYNTLRLFRGMRFAQAIVHQLEPSEKSYAGRYQGADTVEGPK